MTERYGKTRMSKIRAEGTPAVQDAWDRIDAGIWAEADRQDRKGQR